MKSKHCGVSQNMYQGLFFWVTKKLIILFKAQQNYFRYFQDFSLVTSMWRQKKNSIKMCWNNWKVHPMAGKCNLGHFLVVDGNGSSGILQAVIHPIWCHKLKSVSTHTADTARRERMCLFTCFWATVHLCHIWKQKCVFCLSLLCLWYMVLCWNYHFKLCQNFTQLSHVPREPYFDLGAKWLRQKSWYLWRCWVLFERLSIFSIDPNPQRGFMQQFGGHG